MASIKRTTPIVPTDSKQIEQKQPFGRYRYVDVTFPPERNRPVAIYPGFSVTDSTKWRWIDTKATGPWKYDATALTDGVPNTWVHAGGNFTANGSMTWTVDSGDLLINHYEFTRNPVDASLGMMTMYVQIATSTIGGVANTTLYHTLPSGIVAAAACIWQVDYANDSGTVVDALASISALSGTIAFTKTAGGNWTLGTNSFYLYHHFTIPVQGIPQADQGDPRIFASPYPSFRQSTTEYLALCCNVPSYSTRLLVWEERN